MAWTYSETSVTTDLAKIRLLIGDTNSKDKLLTDEEIAGLNGTTTTALAGSGSINMYLAASRCVPVMMAIVARRIDTTGPRFGATRSQIFQHFKDLKEMLDRLAGTVVSPVAWSEFSEADRSSILSDSDFRPPSFEVGRDDHINGDAEDEE